MIALRQALYVSRGAAPKTHAEALANIMRVIQERQAADHNGQEDEKSDVAAAGEEEAEG